MQVGLVEQGVEVGQQSVARHQRLLDDVNEPLVKGRGVLVLYTTRRGTMELIFRNVMSKSDTLL